MEKVLEIIVRNPPSILFILSFGAVFLMDEIYLAIAFLVSGFILQVVWLLRQT